ncbi:MAG: hypothetical protein AVO38_09825 [delta proteobacterium ML8_D]|nr:MAG: hypothetical protein AVO38_09825 [delta proteobacterium ML8_D]
MDKENLIDSTVKDEQLAEVRGRQHPSAISVLMTFIVADQDILNHAILLRDQMHDLPVALIIPDADRETIIKSHKFYPRFIAFADSDYSDLTLALKKIIQRECGIFNKTGSSGVLESSSGGYERG